jgi:purine-binding chemotaxis protein CheW
MFFNKTGQKMNDTINSYLSFKIGSEYYAANVSFVQNIIEFTEITKVPEMPVFMLGVINLRGQVLPVIDTRIKFGLSYSETTTNTCILVMEVTVDEKHIMVGALVDAVAEVLEISEDDINETPSIGTTIRNKYISGVYHDKEKFIMILDMNQILASDELLNLNKLSDSVEA